MANENDRYNEMMRQMAQQRQQQGQPRQYPTNNGGVYFNSAQRPAQPAPGQAQRPAPQRQAPQRPVQAQTGAAGGAKKSKKKKKKRSGASSFFLGLIKIIVTVGVIIAVALLIRIPLMSAINDVLALDGTKDEFAVTLDKTLEYDEVIDLLCATPCESRGTALKFAAVDKFVAKFMDFDDYAYPPGTYYISTSMGLEGMLQVIASAGNEDGTVTLTFPEGYTVDQIAERLELNGVCSKKSFYAALASDEPYEKYDFLKSIPRSERYRAIEGYMYPDTYEFYVGEDPFSVIYRFVNNFESKWTEEYSARAEELGMSMDDIVKIASIVQKEGVDADQMKLISSILYNRLRSDGLFPFINCDSTAYYIENARDIIADEAAYNGLLMNYDTYQHEGLPTGPISNPGADAIYSALYPADSDYYYFLHDSEGKMYVARTAEEHAANRQYLGQDS